MVGFVSGVHVGGEKRHGVRRVGVCARRDVSVPKMSSSLESEESVPKMSSSLESEESTKGTDFLRLAEFSAMLGTMMVMSPWMAQAVEAATDAKPTLQQSIKALFKTIPLSLMHPIAMGLLASGAVFAMYTGIQVRTLRTTKDRETKMTLAKQKPGTVHFNLTAGMLSAVTFFTFEGMANTFTRTGKLFPGPHLYNGLGLISVMATMASLVPAMQKGKSWAKNSHFALAFVALGLFGWQAQSGLQITMKLLKIK